jgi:hypothetical protein
MIAALPTIASALKDAIVAYFNGSAGDRPSLSPELSFGPVHSMGDLASLQVSVVPRQVDVNTMTRAANLVECLVDVGFQIRINPESTDSEFTQISAVMTTAGLVATWMMKNRVLSGHEDQPLQGISVLPGITQNLNEQRFVTVVITGRFVSQGSFT